jgi:anti-sigma regulatory factor (Ser/Thr protein kinase)/transposase-like protein
VLIWKGCPKCYVGRKHLVRNGTDRKGRQRYKYKRCKACVARIRRVPRPKWRVAGTNVDGGTARRIKTLARWGIPKTVIGDAVDLDRRTVAKVVDYFGKRRSSTPSHPPHHSRPVPTDRPPAVSSASRRDPTSSRTLRYQPHGDWTGEWDADRLRQVVSNLLGNAVQHGAGPIELTVSAEGGDVRLVVHNGGTPIPASVLPTLFDPFVRGTAADSPARRRHGSLGLGLYIAREVVTAHGGTVDVTSSADGGTAFTVRLPRDRRARV